MQIGDRLPVISLPDDKGSMIDLSNYKGQKLILYFYPKDNTPGCTNEAVAFEYERGKFEEQGYTIVGVSPDSSESHAKFREKYDLGYKLLSDTDKRLCEMYGVWVQKRMYGKSYMGVQRSTFVYDENGILVKVYPKVKPADHPVELLEDIIKGKIAKA